MELTGLDTTILVKDIRLEAESAKDKYLGLRRMQKWQRRLNKLQGIPAKIIKYRNKGS